MATRLPEAEDSTSDEGPNEDESEANVNLRSDKHQKSGQQTELPLGGRGEAPTALGGGESPMAGNEHERSGSDRLMELVVEQRNVEKAMKRVKQNKGSPGVDGMTVDELPKYLAENWEGI